MECYYKHSLPCRGDSRIVKLTQVNFCYFVSFWRKYQSECDKRRIEANGGFHISIITKSGYRNSEY